MTVFWHEIKRGRRALIIWTAAIAAMLAISVFVYPQMREQMEGMNEMFADMGAFTAAFGMDKLNFGEFKGYFAVECGNVLGLGGAMFAAVLGIAMLGKEQKDNTADFLLTHPIKRSRIVLEKLLSVYAQILVLNIAVAVFAALSILAIGEKLEIKLFLLLFAAYTLMQLELASICFGISAFLSSSGFGIGIGIALLAYFLNILSNITEDAEFLKFITPFAYADGAEIVTNAKIMLKYLASGMLLALAGVIAAFLKYPKKDL